MGAVVFTMSSHRQISPLGYNKTPVLQEQRSYPFHFKHLNLCHSLQELEKIPSPYVLLTSMADLSYGFARSVRREFQ